MRLIALLICCTALAWAGESAAIADFKKAMAGEDGVEKRNAINALAAKEAGSDDEILPLLVSAVSDRQGNEPAIRALRARTGLTPPSRMGGTAYPGYPGSDTAADWQAWLTARTRDMETKKKLDKMDKKLDQIVEAKAADETPAPEVAPVAPPPRIPTDDLGKIDRIIYKSSRTLTAFVRSKRLDGDGNLVSVRVVHRDGVGEEVIDASVIARIEEDIE
jgi:hypothetical protein